MIPNPATRYRPFPPIELADRTWPSQVLDQPPIWCSVDLRDGNQALINPMGPAKKMELFRTLLKVGFKEIEVGFPAASETDFDVVRKLIDEDLIPEDVTIQVLTQAREHLIKRTFEAIRGSRRAIVHLYNSTSTLQRRVVFRMDRAGVTEIAVNGTRLIKELAEETKDTEIVFQYSPESFTGTEVDFSAEICDAVCTAWQPTLDNKAIINLPSTVELATPNVYADQIELFCRLFEHRDRSLISLHTHNDRGTGIAASELGLMAGADRVEGTLFGNGERTGNVDIVTMALNFYTQGVHPNLDLSNIKEVRRVAEFCTELPVHERHPYAGDLVFTAFSGSHQDAIKKGYEAMEQSGSEVFEVPYLTIAPGDIGRHYDPVIRVNSQSGKGGVAFLVEKELGFRLPRGLQIDFSKVIQKIAEDTGRELQGGAIAEKFLEDYVQPKTTLEYVNHRTLDNDDETEWFQFDVVFKGEASKIEGKGNGPLDSFVNAITDAFALGYDVRDYSEHSMESGSDSAAAAYVLVQSPAGDEVWGVGKSKSITRASVLALVAAINRTI